MGGQDKTETFRRLHAQPGCLVMPNPWDAGSARILETLGFKALATTSAGLAFSLAKPDGANAVPRHAALDNSRAIVGAVTVPVSADLENLYGDEPVVCAETIELAVAAGLAGCSIEDATGRADDPIYPLERAAERVRAAAEASAGRLLLTARSENYLLGRPFLKETIARLQAYQEAGADVLYAPGLKTAAEIRTLCAEVDRPVNVVMGLRGVQLSVSELTSLGVKRISTGSALARAALGALLRAAQEIASDGTFTFADQAVAYDEINRVFGG